MPLLIDCYNVLYATMPPCLAGLEEAGLCHALTRSVWADDRIVVVCDGGVKPHGPARSPVAGVRLIYSGKDRSADDVMITMIGKDSAPRRLTVVSSDRQIQKAARRRRCRVVSSDQFISMLATGHAPSLGQGSAEGDLTKPLSEGEVNRWLKQFGVDGVDDDEISDSS